MLSLTLETFPKSNYYKLLHSKPERKISFGLGKSIDGYCTADDITTYYFKREKISFVFHHGDKDPKKHFLTGISIKSRKAPFKTDDSIRVGDKIPITKFYKDLSQLTERYVNGQYKYANQIPYGTKIYYIKKIRIRKLHSKTMVRIKEIYIRPERENI